MQKSQVLEFILVHQILSLDCKYKKTDRWNIFFKGGMELKSIVKLKKKCDHFVILDEELGTEKKHFAKVARRRIWPGTEKLIDRYFVIGKYGYDASRIFFQK